MRFVDIESRFGEVKLRLTPVAHPFDAEASEPAWSARLTGKGLQAEGVFAEERERAQTLVDFFNEIHAEHRGWDGAKEWGSLGGELRIRTDHDQINTVRLHVTLSGGPHPQWSASAELHVDPGRFHRVGANLELFAEQLRSGELDPDAASA